MTQETLWITGASSGIGRALAKHYANNGCRVIASARNTEALNELAASSENIETIPFDVTCPTSIAPVRYQLASVAPTLDRVIINAGHCEYLQFPAPDWRMIDRVLAVNFLGAVHTVEIRTPLDPVFRSDHWASCAARSIKDRRACRAPLHQAQISRPSAIPPSVARWSSHHPRRQARGRSRYQA